VQGTISTVIGTRNYLFSGINTGVQATTGVQGAFNVRSIRYSLGDGAVWVTPRSWEWFELYNLGQPEVTPGPPKEWSQYGQGGAPGSSGSGGSGSFYVSPAPDAVYVLNGDCTCFPQPLAVDGDVEAIPYIYTDAVPWLAAYYALISAQTNARLNDALNYYKIYKEWVERCRKISNPAVLRWQYEQGQDPAQASKFNVKPGAAA
jgi:hypothetical protein